MKFPSILAASLLAAVSAQGDHRLLATLAEKRNLTDPTFAYDSNTLNLTFPVTTDIISTGMAQYSLWTAPGCQSEGGTSLDGSTVWVRPPILVENEALVLGGALTDRGAVTGRNATIVVAFNPETVTTSNIYSDTSANGQASAEIRFCMRFGLWTTEARMGVTTPVEVNFLETLVTLTVDLTDGFEIGAIDVGPKDRLLQTADRAYVVRGYECSANSFDELTEDEKSHPRKQGEIIHVCVAPEQDAITAGIFMRSVDDFTFSRGDIISQSAIKENRAAGNLTSYNNTECEGALVCRFSTTLVAQFYATPGTVLGVGIGSMQSGNTKTGQTRRQLRSERELQAAWVVGVAEFDLNFEVAQAEAQSESGAGLSSMGATMTMVIAAVAALL